MLSEFEKKVADFAKANELFGSAERILLAVSGGADSTALLFVVRRLLDEGVFSAELRCAHINHQLRGCEADLDEQFVVAQAGELNLPIITKRVDVCKFARQNKLSIETSARKLRLESLLEIAKASHCNVIATAHQKNDNAETILHRLLRGTGFRGLAGIWPVQALSSCVVRDASCVRRNTIYAIRTTNNFVRPLLCVQRDEIIKFLQERNLKWREDHTNADCTYTRNYIRHRLLPALQADYTHKKSSCVVRDASCEEKNATTQSFDKLRMVSNVEPYAIRNTQYEISIVTESLAGSIVEDLSRLAQQGRKLNNLVRERAERVWLKLAKTDENSVMLNLKNFLVEPKIVKVELIRRSITTLGSGERDLTQRHYEKILQLPPTETFGGSNRRNELPGGFEVWCESGNLIFARPQRISVGEKQIIESVKLKVPGQTSILRRSPKDERFGRYMIEATILDAEKKDLKEFKTEKNNFVERFDLDRIKLPIVVRFRRRGDRFGPLGMAAQKKVGKFLTDAKVPQKMRSKTLVIADSEKIIWIWPIRISEQAKLTGRARRVLQLRITEAEPPQ